MSALALAIYAALAGACLSIVVVAALGTVRLRRLRRLEEGAALVSQASLQIVPRARRRRGFVRATEDALEWHPARFGGIVPRFGAAFRVERKTLAVRGVRRAAWRWEVPQFAAPWADPHVLTLVADGSRIELVLPWKHVSDRLAAWLARSVTMSETVRGA